MESFGANLGEGVAGAILLISFAGSLSNGQAASYTVISDKAVSSLCINVTLLLAGSRATREATNDETRRRQGRGRALIPRDSATSVALPLLDHLHMPSEECA